MSAKTRADLTGLFDDLPETGAPAATDHPRRRRRGHPAMVLALLVFLALAAGHAVFWVIVPVLWLGLLVATGLFVTRAVVGRSRSSHDR